MSVSGDSGVVLSDTFTVGQLTFGLRIIVQVLSYGGLALISILILANTPRLAPIATHDVVSRHVGRSTTIGSTVKWLWPRIRRNAADPYPPTNLLLSLFLAISFAGFVAFSDVGFLGFYSCNVPGKNVYDQPASANTTEAALKVLGRNMINGTDPSKVKTFRCDSSEHWVLDNGILDRCTSWKNGTYGDQSFFRGLNTTDSDVLMPRQISVQHHNSSDRIYLSNYYNGLGTALNPSVHIVNGMVLDPHVGGLTATIGIPSIRPEFQVTIDKTMAIEVDIACMTTGILTVHTVGAGGIGRDSMALKARWGGFTGPEYMKDILAKTVDDVRAFYKPVFDGFTPDDDGYIYSNDTNTILSRAANIGSWRFPYGLNNTLESEDAILGNCSAALQTKLGLQNITTGTSTPGRMCSFLGLGGSIAEDGSLQIGFSRMVCAAAPQVNMVHAVVGVSPSSVVTANLTRLPSDLNYLRADYWDVVPPSNGSNTTDIWTFDTYERYTLSENPNGKTQHYIPPRRLSDYSDMRGLGSAGTTISGLADVMMYWPSLFDKDYQILNLLPEGYNTVNFSISTDLATRWVAQIGASGLENSLGYNGWAGINALPLLVVSTGGKAGTCYHTPYAVGFLPLLLALGVVIIWTTIMILRGSLSGTGMVKDAYGGISTYVSNVCPGAPNDALLVWEKDSEPRLQVVTKGMPVVGDGSTTALQHMKSGPPEYPFYY